MRRFFVPRDDIQGNVFRIKGPDHHHIFKVLRLTPGAPLILIDEDGMEYHGVITNITKEEVLGSITKSQYTIGEPNTRVVLAQGLPKGDKLDLVVRMCTEVGVTEVIPMVTQRTISRPEPSKIEKRKQRWQRIAQEAAKQSRRGRVPLVRDPLSFQDVIQEALSGDLALMAWESADGEQHLSHSLSMRKGNGGSIYILIGPEGGFSEDEVEMARSFGVARVSLGNRILRTETAGLVLISLVLYELGELGGRR